MKGSAVANSRALFSSRKGMVLYWKMAFGGTQSSRVDSISISLSRSNGSSMAVAIVVSSSSSLSCRCSARWAGRGRSLSWAS